MFNSKVITLKKPGEFIEDPLTELLRTGARQLIANAVEAELHSFNIADLGYIIMLKRKKFLLWTAP